MPYGSHTETFDGGQGAVLEVIKLVDSYDRESKKRQASLRCVLANSERV